MDDAQDNAKTTSTKQKKQTTAPVESNGSESRVMAPNALLLGLDLGTSRSSIVSMNGPRKVIESYVGWPKDSISRKHLKADILFGRTALDNRLALDLYRPLEKGVIKGTRDDDNPSSKEHAKNLVAKRSGDNRDILKPVKKSQRKRNDGMLALLMAINRAIAHREESGDAYLGEVAI